MTTPEPNPAEMLAELLENAPPEARREITAWLLRTLQPAAVGIPWLPPPAGFPIPGQPPSPELDDRLRRITRTLPSTSDSQMVTIRLPVTRHAALRDWCTEHGFSMAAVVRGLVERFLEEQAAPS